MSREELEARLMALERDVAQLKGRLVPGNEKQNWVENISGTFKDDPEWEEVCRLCAELRKADQMHYDDQADK